MLAVSGIHPLGRLQHQPLDLGQSRSVGSRASARWLIMWPKQTTLWPKLSSQDNHFGIFQHASGGDFSNPIAAMSKVSGPPFEGIDDPLKHLREFAAECMELAQTTPSPEKRMMYLKMAALFH